jgi:hypothetical protein
MISSDNALIRELWKEHRDAPLTALFLLGPIVVLLVASFIVNQQRRGILITFGLMALLVGTLYFVANAQQTIPADSQIVMKVFPGSLYFGVGVPYTITISATGAVTIETKPLEFQKPIAGEVFKNQISQEQVREIILDIEQINFFSLNERYGNLANYQTDENCPSVMTDSSTVEITVTLNGKTKTVSHYLGCQGKPILGKLENFENRIEKVVQADKALEKYWKRN